MRTPAIRSKHTDRPADPPRPAPLLVPTVAFIAGIVVAEQGGPWSGVFTSALNVGTLVGIIVLLAGSSRIQSKSIRLALLLACAAGAGFGRHQSATQLATDHIAHQVQDQPTLARIEATVITAPQSRPAVKRNAYLPYAPSPRTRFIVNVHALHNSETPTELSGYLRVNVKDDNVDARLGDTVILTGWLYRPFAPRNDGETDWRYQDRLQHIHAGLSVPNAELVEVVQSDDRNVYTLLASVRNWTRQFLFEPFAEDDSDQPTQLLDAMVLGHRSAAGRDLNEAFLRTGTLHFLAVSGFHVGVLALTTVWFFRRLLRRSTHFTAIATICMMLAYVLIAEQNAPILRAATMVILGCIAHLVRRPIVALNWLTLSALLLLIDPLQLFRAGFQLSFVQVLVLLTIISRIMQPALHGRRDDEIPSDADTWTTWIGRTLYRYAAGLAIICVCAWLSSLPLVLFHFGRFAPWAPLQSMIISPLVVLTIMLGFATILLAWVPLLGLVLGAMLRLMTIALLSTVDYLAQAPGSLIETPSPPAWIIFASYG